MKVERVSYEVMTPSAARGLLEAVLWKPAITWRIHSIAVLAPIRWTSFRRNEVINTASLKRGPLVVDNDTERTQRNTVALRDVSYRIEASFALTHEAKEDDTVTKFCAMFQRRLAQGQRFHQPYLGCREFVADVRPWDGPVTPIDPAVRRPLGWMFYDFDFHPSTHEAQRPLFFEAVLDGGVLNVPSREEVINMQPARGATP